ncbi:MAG: class II aldolase/adducin family protein [Deltaproteobacteria bacterium]|nr:class II aldolase/adducin family protein [Deltaproteobacteria bacterium]MBW2659056.1 class II aldolase/adducin family protein [Deltaproteobacteria bacterium]
MEKYQGIKFEYCRTKPLFKYDHRLEILNHWSVLFGELGLAPVHSSGTYGNQSYRTSSSSFIITRTGMCPRTPCNEDDFVHVTGFDAESGVFTTEGTAVPSSECYLHNALYVSLPKINAILHGHSPLLCHFADQLNIPETHKFYDYGTPELAESALQLLKRQRDFFILKDHGFVALGQDIESAGRLTLDYYLKLITLIRDS